MDRRASTAETVCESGLRRIAEATERAGLSDVAEEALALLPWEAPSSVAWRAEAERLMSERTRLLGIHPALATWDLATPEGLARIVGLARRGPFM